MLFGVSDFDRSQLVFTSFLAMDSHQGQRHVSTTPGGGFLPFLHSVRDLVQSSHQRFQIILKRRPRPKRRVDSRDNLLQACEVACGAGDTGLQSEHVHRSFVADRGSDRVKTCLDPPSFFVKVLTKFCSQKSVQSTEQNPMANINTVRLKEIPPSTR